MAAPPAVLFPPMQMPPLPIRSPSPPPHFPIPGPHDSLRRLPKPLPDFDFDWALPTRSSPPGPRPRRPFSWTADDDDGAIRFHARQNSTGSVASTPTAPSPSHSRWPSSAGSIVSSSRPSYEHDRPAAPPPDWMSGKDSSPPPRRKPYFSTHQQRSPDMGATAPYPEPPIGAAQNSFRTPQVVVEDAPRGTGGAKAERASRTRVEKDGISDIICEIDAALDRIGGARAAALKSPSPLPSPGTPVRSEFGSRFKVRQESPLRHGRSVTMPENLGGGQGEEGNPGGGGGSLATPMTRFNHREPHSPTTSSPLKGRSKRNGAPLVGPPPVSSRARYRPVSDVVVAHASSVAAPKTTFPAPGLAANNNVTNGGKPSANTSVIRTAMAPDPSTALHSNPPCTKRCTMPPGALLSSGTTRSVSSGTTLVSNHSSLEQNGAGNGRSFSSPLGNIAAAASSTPALYCSPDTPPVPPVHRNAVSDPASLTDGSALYPNQQHARRPRALSTSSTPSPSASPSPSPYATAASTSRSTSGPSSHTNSTELFSSPQSSPSSRSRSPSSSSRSSSSSQRGRQLRRKFSPRRASLRELRDKHSDACLKRAFEWGVQRYLEGTIFWDGKEADLFLGPEAEGEGPVGGGGGGEMFADLDERERGRGRPLLHPLDGVHGGGGAAEQWSDCREWRYSHSQPHTHAYTNSYNNSSDDVGDVWHDAASMDVGVGVALGDPYVDHGATTAAAYGYEQGYESAYGGYGHGDGGYGHGDGGYSSGNRGYGNGNGNAGYRTAVTHANEKESDMAAGFGGFGSGGARGWAEEVLGAAIG